MREIKFRAWDKNEKQMISDLDDDIITAYFRGRKDEVEVTLEDVNSTLNLEEFVWMQFTGLLDKNGVEIYEGDIILFPFDHGAGEAMIPAIVEWSGLGYSPFFDTGVTDCIKIGNKFENPELLGGSK